MILSILVIGVALIPPFKQQKAAVMISALFLVTIVAYQWLSFVLNRLNWGSIVGVPEPLIGLNIIALGAILVLAVAIWNYQVRSETAEL